MNYLSDLLITLLRWLGPHEVEALFSTLGMLLIGNAAALALIAFVYGLKVQHSKPQPGPHSQA